MALTFTAVIIYTSSVMSMRYFMSVVKKCDKALWLKTLRHNVFAYLALQACIDKPVFFAEAVLPMHYKHVNQSCPVHINHNTEAMYPV